MLYWIKKEQIKRTKYNKLEITFLSSYQVISVDFSNRKNEKKVKSPIWTISFSFSQEFKGEKFLFKKKEIEKKSNKKRERVKGIKDQKKCVALRIIMKLNRNYELNFMILSAIIRRLSFSSYWGKKGWSCPGYNPN